MRSLLALLILTGCPQPPPAVVPRPEPIVEPKVEDTPAPPPIAPRVDFTVGESPMSLVVWRDHLVWTDAAGAIWSMPTGGGTPRQLSDQKSPNFAFKVFVAGDQVFATSRKELLRVESPTGPVAMAGVLSLADNPLDATASADHIFLTVFKRDEIVRASPAGGAAKKVASLSRGILAANASTLFVASYASGTVLAMPLPDGATKTIAKGFAKPTALAADDSRVFVYSEKDEALYRVVIATGEKTKIADGLVNSDELVSDGAWLYTRSWSPRGQLLRVSKDGGRAPQVIADDLKSPYGIAFDGEYVYASIRDQNKIVKLAKAAL